MKDIKSIEAIEAEVDALLSENERLQAESLVLLRSKGAKL